MRQMAKAFALLSVSTALATPVLAQEATITRTEHNIPHIQAETWRGVGYGVAYAYAQDNICLLAEEFATIRGERSLHFGAEGSSTMGFREVDNVTSDFFYRSQLETERLRMLGLKQDSYETTELMRGYVAGYNRYLRDTGDNLPEACAGKDWVQPITTDDMRRLNGKQMLLASSLALAPGIATAAPPDAPNAAYNIRIPEGFPAKDEPTFGSNGWAFGGDATADGSGLLIGNPHFPWEGPARFWQMHVRGPDGYDVMGVGLAGNPIPTLGFNKDVAWTHTVTAARHFAVYALTLSPDDPTAYMLDGEAVKMEAREISVPMPDGSDPATRTFYSTKFGPIVTVPGTPFGWSTSQAFALRDPNAENGRALDAWLGIGKASNVAEIEAAVSETLGIPWVNTIAVDREGNALHADITVVPNVTGELIETCSTPFSGLVAGQVTLLDGSRSECDTNAYDEASTHRGLLPAVDQASRTRRDYVTNSNDSYWLSHAGEPYRKLSPILGAHMTELSLRSRSNFMETEATLAEAPMERDRAKAIVFGNKSLAADMSIDAVLKLCAGSNSAAGACSVLAAWDRRFDSDSTGAHLFVNFWDKIRRSSNLWDVPFDPENPIATPHTLATGGEQGEAIVAALKEAGDDLTARGFALDARWGDVQVRLAGEDRIAIHGGPGEAGVLNMQRSRDIEGGLTPVHGSSYIQIVGFDEDGPVADAILSYSQSTNPASPHYADQTRLYAAKEWVRLPFSDEEIEAARVGDVLVIAEE